MCLFGCSGSELWHSGFFFSCGLQTLSCGIWDLVLWPGVESRPLALGTQSPVTGPPGNSWCFTAFFLIAHHCVCVYIYVCVCVCVHAQLCPTLCNPINCSPPVSIYGIFQARTLEGLAISFSSGSLPARDRTWVSCSAGGFFMNWATREAPTYAYIKYM